jgi:hypothetical protein
MFTFAAAVRLRFVVILSVLSQLAAAQLVRGRQNDPLQNATWWGRSHHSAVMVVALGTAVATVLMYALLRTKLAHWWSFTLAGALTGLFPALFYLVATPSADIDWVPIGPMMARGMTVGLLTGFVSYFVTKREEVASEA